MDFQKRTLLILALLSCAGLSCAKKTSQPQGQTPIQEAYSLMDHGKNAKAILLLERITREEPGNDEARVLLASAYLGEAGVDIYKIHDTFQDILFSKPLGDSFWHSPALKVQVEGNPAASSTKDTPAEKWIDQIDVFLEKLRHWVNFLNRFPDVESERWGLLEKAIEHLDSVKQTRDVCLYKVLIRVIYLKSFLGHEVIQNPEVGTRSWACHLELEQLRESVNWLTRHLVAASEDFRKVFPDKASSLDGLHGEVAGMQAFLDDLSTQSPAGTQSGLLSSQEKLRNALHCEPKAPLGDWSRLRSA